MQQCAFFPNGQSRAGSAEHMLQFENQLKGMGFDMNQIWQVLGAVQNDMACGPECQKQRELNELQDKVAKAKRAEEDAPGNLATARKNYYDFKDGPLGYLNYQKREYTAAGKDEIKQLRTQFDARAATVGDNVQQYNAMQVYMRNMEDLLQKYITRNQALKKSIDDMKKQVFTDDRRDFYFNQSIDWQYYVNKTMQIVYWTVLVIFAGYYVVYKGNYKDKWVVLSVVLLIALPYALTLLLTTPVFGVSIQSVADRSINAILGK